MSFDIICGETVEIELPSAPTLVLEPPTGSVTVVDLPSFTVTVEIPAQPTLQQELPDPSDVVVVPIAGPPGPTGAQGPGGETGPEGPAGPAGPGGGGYFAYIQISPAATWIINHNLGRLVHVTLLDSGNDIAYADVIQGTLNQATIVFAVPTVGSAVLS